MTEIDIKKKLVDRFLKMNDIAGVPLLSEKNVHVTNDNKGFEIPASGRWFELTVLYGEGTKASQGKNAMERYSGTLQVDVCVPLNCGTAEIEDKNEMIHGLFPVGEWIDEIEITGIQPSRETADALCFRKIVRINWTCDIQGECYGN